MSDYERTIPSGGGVIRLRGNCKRTQKDGWHAADITVEYTGDPDGIDPGFFRCYTEDIYSELSEACAVMNGDERQTA